MSDCIDTKQRLTVFSINPITGLPFMEYDRIEALIYTHIIRYSTNLHQHKYMNIEDLKQEVILRLLSTSYDPTKCSPKTWIIKVATCHLGNIKNTTKRNKRTNHFGQDPEVSDFIISDEGEDDQYATDFIGVETINPEEYMLANELVEGFLKDPPKRYDGKPRSTLPGYTQVRKDKEEV